MSRAAESLLEEACVKVAKSGVIEDAILKAVENTITKVVAESLSSYSDFGKQVKEAVTKSLAIGDELDLPKYNEMVIAVVRRQVEAETKRTIEGRVTERITDLLDPAPEEIKLSKLVEQYTDWLRDRYNDGCVCHGETTFTFLMEESDYGHRHVYIDRESDKRKYDCDVHISLTKDGRMYHLRLSRESQDKLFAGQSIYGFEKAVFNMHAAGTRIIVDIDQDDVDTNYGSYD